MKLKHVLFILFLAFLKWRVKPQYQLVHAAQEPRSTVLSSDWQIGCGDLDLNMMKNTFVCFYFDRKTHISANTPVVFLLWGLEGQLLNYSLDSADANKLVQSIRDAPAWVTIVVLMCLMNKWVPATFNAVLASCIAPFFLLLHNLAQMSEWLYNYQMKPVQIG